MTTLLPTNGRSVVVVVGCWLLVVGFGCWLLVLVVGCWLIFSSIFVGKMCVFVSRPMKIVTFLRKNDYTQNGLLIFLWKETHSETKSWTSSGILTKKVTTTTVNPGNRRDFACESKFFHVSFFFHHFSPCFRLFFIFHFFFFSFFFHVFIFFFFFHFFIFSHLFIFFFFFHFFMFFSFFHFFSIFHFPSFSFMFLHFPSFSFIFLHFPSFSFIFPSFSLHFLAFSFIFF